MSSQDFTVDVLFVLDSSAKLTQIAIRSAKPAAAGDEVLSSFKAAEPLPAIPKAAECIVGQQFGYRIEHQLTEAAPH